MKVHPIRIDFYVTEEIKRYVYVYLLEAGACYLIDSGVAGCQDIICKKLKKLGKDISDIKGIFLTHAHPDHIGTAGWFRDKNGCTIYASAGEKPWIEDISFQYKERPIPGFYRLAGQSVPVDKVVGDGDKIELEEHLLVEVIGTPGHSSDEISFRIDDSVFIGDSIPVKGDIPIYVDRDKTLKSMNRLLEIKGAAWFYPAWDKTYSREELKEKIIEGKCLVERLEASVKKNTPCTGEISVEEMVHRVYQSLEMPWLKSNPLFAETVKSHMIASAPSLRTVESP